MIPVTYPSSVSTSKESQMVVFALSSVAGLQRWTDYIPVKFQSTGSDVPNSFNTNGYIACDFITSLTGKQAWVDYIPVFVDSAATTAWQVSDTGFIPFNTLAGGGTYVSLDLNFLNTTALDSRITFSRGTNATLTDSNGRIAWAPHNLLTNSEDFEAAAWTKNRSSVSANSTQAPDGSLTSDTLIEDATNGQHYVAQSVTVPTAVHTISAYFKAKERSVGVLSVSTFRANFDLTTVSVSETAGSPTSTSIVAVGNGWYRCSMTMSLTAGASAFIVGVCATPTGFGYTGDGTSGIFIWGAQLNIGSTAQSYNSTTPKNLLGFTQEPENAAWTKSNSYVQQNLLTWSQDFDNAAWVKTTDGGITVSANTIVAPDGTLTADKFIPNAVAGFHAAQQTYVFPNTAHSFSFYAKAGEYSAIQIFDGLTTDFVNFNLLTGQVGSSSGYTGAITSVGDGWYRCTGTKTFAAGSTAIRIGVVTSSTAVRGESFTGNGTNGAFIWGAQLVQGSTAGDYTQTTSAAAPTRYLNWDGTLTGRKLVEDTVNTVHLVREPFTSTGVPYSLNVYAKAGERSFVLIRTLDPSSDKYTWFNLANGTVGTTASGHTASIQSVGNGWYRCNVTYTFIAGSCFVYAGVANADNVSAYTGDGTSGIYVSDFQLSNSASVDPYVYNPQAAAASAAYYGPRFDYDPVTLAAKGLLIEEQRTNLFTYSEQFNNAAWIRNNATVTANAEVSPDGTTTAESLTATTNTAYIASDINYAVTSYQISFYVKAGTGNVVWLYVRNAAANGTAYFDLSDLSTQAVAGTFSTPSNLTITSVGSGWYRLSATFNNGVALVSGSGIGVADAKGSPNATSGKSIFIWGAQLEAGSFATSYIPTVASQVTRNADSASMLGDNFYTWFNPNQGTLSAEATAYAGTATNRYYEFSDGTSANVIQSFAGPSTIYTEWVYVGGVPQAQLSSSGSPTSLTKIAAAYKQNDFAASLNGATPATDTSGAIPPVNKLNIGSASNGSSNLNGTIRRINYYNTRLDNATLQALTT